MAALLLLLPLWDHWQTPIRTGRVDARPLDPGAAEESRTTVTLAFVGDVMLAESIGYLARARGPEYLLSGVAEVLREADIAVANLETAVSTRGAPAADKQYTFRSHPEALKSLTAGAIDLVSVANNHSLDYGRQAFVDTMSSVRAAGIEVVGGGADAAAALAPVILRRNGLRIAFIGVSRVIPEGSWVAAPGRPGVANGYEVEPLLAAVRAARTQADVVVVLLHWGDELAEAPRRADIDLAEALTGAGAAVVVGHHPHVLQGVQWRGNSLVAYSLGNFLFPYSGKTVTRLSAILMVDVGPGRARSARLVPVVLDGGRPRVAREPWRPGAAQEPGRPSAPPPPEPLQRIQRLSRPFQTTVTGTGEILPAR